MVMIFHFWLLILMSGCQLNELASVDLTAVQGSEGVLIWTAAELTEPVILQMRSPANTWTNIDEQDGCSAWWDPEGTVETKYRLASSTGSGYSAAALPKAITVDLQTTSENLVYYAGESASVDVTFSCDQAIPFESTIAFKTNGYLSDSSQPQEVIDHLVFESVDASDWNREVMTYDPGSAAVVDVTAVLSVEVEHLGKITLERASHSVSFSAYEVFWGDLHAHSNLSVDGCEDDSDKCGDRLSTAAEDFFEQAMNNGLTFAAITEHAEYTDYSPDGSKELRINIWAAQQSLVQEASKYENFVPILGYEWTHNGDQGAGGHKTVLFDQPTACDAYHIGAEASKLRTKVRGEGVYYGPNPVIAQTPVELYAALDGATEECEPRGVVTYFHHPALDRPQSVNWVVKENEPNPSYEKVVEIFSEHGSSEMTDPDDDNQFGVDPNKEYKGGGSAERGLSLGYRLGFVGGTDSHDSRPGSLEDGPSCPDHWQDGNHLCQYGGGAITGALTSELSRANIFGAIQSRHTIVSTGPRPELRALITSAAGIAYLPGDVVPTGFGPYDLLVDQGLNDPEALAVELVASRFDLEEKIEEGLPLSMHLRPQSGDWLYLRLTYVTDDGEHRVWVSPWFFE